MSVYSFVYLFINLFISTDLGPAVDGPRGWARCEVAEVGSQRRCGRVASVVWNDHDVVEERHLTTTTSAIIIYVMHHLRLIK